MKMDIGGIVFLYAAGYLLMAGIRNGLMLTNELRGVRLGLSV